MNAATGCIDCTSPTLWGETPYCESCAAARRAALTSVEVARPEHHWRCGACGSRVIHANVTVCWDCRQHRAPSSVTREPAGDLCAGCGFFHFTQGYHRSDCTGAGRECPCGEALLTIGSRLRGRCSECQLKRVNDGAAAVVT